MVEHVLVKCGIISGTNQRTNANWSLTHSLDPTEEGASHAGYPAA